MGGPMTAPLIRFEVDISPAIGSGHLSRCKVLAHALAAAGARCVFRLHGLDDPALAAPFAYAGTEPFDAAVVDRYTASAADIDALRASCSRVLVFDDHAERAVRADLLLNGNYYAQELDYARFSLGEALLGPAFSLVTPDFVAAGRAMPVPGHVLLTFGLSRVSAVLPSLAVKLAEAEPGLHFSVIVPQAFRAGATSHPRVTLIEPAPLAQLVGAAEWVISGLGVTWQEIVATGRPNVGVRLVDNQDLMFAALARDGFPVAESPTPAAVLASFAQARKQPAEQWSSLRVKLDGNGPARVAHALLSLLP